MPRCSTMDLICTVLSLAAYTSSSILQRLRTAATVLSVRLDAGHLLGCAVRCYCSVACTAVIDCDSCAYISVYSVSIATRRRCIFGPWLPGQAVLCVLGRCKWHPVLLMPPSQLHHALWCRCPRHKASAVLLTGCCCCSRVQRRRHDASSGPWSHARMWAAALAGSKVIGLC